MAERAIQRVQTLRMVQDQPRGPFRQHIPQHVDDRLLVIERIDPLSRVVQQRRREELLVVGKFIPCEREHLQAVIEQVPFG